MKRFNPHQRRVLGAVAVSAALLVPLGIFGGPALAGMGSAFDQYSGSSQYQYKVTICHRTHGKKGSHTIRVGAPAVKAHLAHGDQLGACPAAAGVQAKHNNGKAKGHAKHQNQGTAGTQQTPQPSSNSNNGNANGHDHSNAGGNGNGKGKGK